MLGAHCCKTLEQAFQESNGECFSVFVLLSMRPEPGASPAVVCQCHHMGLGIC